MLNIGILGLGTVGQGIIEIVKEREEDLNRLLDRQISIKKVLVKNKDKERDIELADGILTDKIEDILEDDDIQIVVEVTSSLEEGYGYIKESIKKGKHIVTANKAIVSKYFEELSDLAQENQVAFLYEASVAGGIPVIKALKEHTALNEINEIQGILNGTCNYILTRMIEEGLDYHEVLKEAQALGYAEADPAADVEGHDTLRKLRIVATIALQGKVGEEDILLEGIERIQAIDIEEIKSLNSTIKLIGEGKLCRDGFTAIVMPSIVQNDSYFANVNQAFNSLAFKGNNVGEVKFYGPGAGKLPTANAILTDVMDIGLDTYRKNNPLGNRRLINNNDTISGQFYLRVSGPNAGLKGRLKNIAERVSKKGRNISIITKQMKLREIYEILGINEVEKKDYFIGRFI